MGIRIEIWLAVGVAFCIAGLIAIAETPAEVSTRVPAAMVAAPAVKFTAIRVLTPGGWIYAQPDETIEIDTESDPPVIRAKFPLGREEAYGIVVGTPTQMFTLRSQPVAGTPVKVYRGGAFMSEMIDFTRDGRVVTFLPGQEIQAGEVIGFNYWRE